jgi:Putative membrane protein insertion efficiency factor
MIRILCFGWLCVFFGHKWYISSCALCCLPRLRITKLSFNNPVTGTQFQTEGNIMQFFKSDAAPEKILYKNIDVKRKYPNSLQLSSFSMVDEPTTTDDDSQSDIKKLLISWIRWYRNTLSPIMPPNCRFLPSCSNYAIQAIDEQGSYRQVAICIEYLMNAI